jgi:hypothetical protein
MSEDMSLKQWNELAALEVQLVQVCRRYLDQRRDIYLMTQLFSFLRPCEVVIRLLLRAVELSQYHIERVNHDPGETASGGIHRTISSLLRRGERFSRASRIWMNSHKSLGPHGPSDKTPSWYFEQALLCIIEIVRAFRGHFSL